MPFGRVYDLSSSTTVRMYSQKTRRKTKSLCKTHNKPQYNHFFSTTKARVALIFIYLQCYCINLGQVSHGFVILEENSSPLSDEKTGDVSDTKILKTLPNVNSGLIDLAEFIARRRETPHLRIRNTSELHVDNHNSDSKEDGVLNNIPSADYLRKVVVLQKPFHFHIPILSQNENKHLHKPTEHSFHSQNSNKDENKKRNNISPGKASDNIWIKRDLQAQVKEEEGLEQNAATTRDPKERFYDNPREVVDLEHLLKEHPKLIPSVSRKRSSGKQEKHHDNLEEDDHHVIGLPVDDDDVVGQGDSPVIIQKRNAKTTFFSQEKIDSILGHEDDLVKYRKKIFEHAKSLDMKPEDVFHSLVFGVASNTELAKESTPNEIYERRLKFHKLFLDDSKESEKYHNEVVDKQVDKQAGAQVASSKNAPFNAYMKILKRSKRGLKSWFKKIFKRGHVTTEKPTGKDPTGKSHDVECSKKSKNKKDCLTVFKEEVNEKGDSQVDFLLPHELRRSAYLKRRTEIKNLMQEEEEIEEEEEKSLEKEPTVREEDSKEEKKDGDDDPDNADKKKKRHDKGHDKGHPSKRNKRSLHVKSGEKKEISLISKDELLVVLEMMFNLIEYQCAEISNKGEVMEGLLTITQTIVKLSTLPEYISERRLIVDKLFNQMLDCSSNTENMSKWAHYQLRRRHQNLGRGEIGAFNGIHRNSVVRLRGEEPLKRTKRVKREYNENGINAAVELVRINGSGLPEVKVEETTTNYNGHRDNHTDIDNPGIKDLMKLYLMIFKIITEVCYNVDNQVLNESSLLLLEEIMMLERNDEFMKEIGNFVGHYDVGVADKMLATCYETEL